jgi:arogenate dehydrogenase (NADP+), plant
MFMLRCLFIIPFFTPALSNVFYFVFFLYRFLTHGHRVLAHSRTDYSDKARELGVEYYDDADDFCEEHPDVVILATSIISTERVLQSLPLQRLKRSTLFVDVLSVKEFPKNLMIKVRGKYNGENESEIARRRARGGGPTRPSYCPRLTPSLTLPYATSSHPLCSFPKLWPYICSSALQILPPYFDILCLHPMFGPDSGRGAWTDLPLVYDKVRVMSEKRRIDRVNSFLAFWEKEGCRMVEMTCEEHDRQAASTQFITHTVGRVLGKMELQSTSINTKGFEALLNLVGNTNNDSFDLYYGLFMYNQNATEELDRLEKAFDQVRAGGDAE